MSFGLFQIAGLVRDDAEVCVGRDFIRFESERLLKRCACGSRVAAIERRQTFVNLTSRRKKGHEKAQKAQNDFSNPFCAFCDHAQLKHEPSTDLNAPRLEDVGIASRDAEVYIV